MLNPGSAVRRCQRFLHAEPNQHDGRQRYDDVNPHRGNGWCRRCRQRLASLSDKVEETCTHVPCPLVFFAGASYDQYACVSRFDGAAAGGGDVGVVVAFVSCRVTKCRFHRVLLLLLGNDLLQGKVGVDLVRILLGTQFQEQSLIDALEFGHDSLLGYILGLRCGF